VDNMDNEKKDTVVRSSCNHQEGPVDSATHLRHGRHNPQPFSHG
jgi:hypothetical protein